MNRFIYYRLSTISVFVNNSIVMAFLFSPLSFGKPICVPVIASFGYEFEIGTVELMVDTLERGSISFVMAMQGRSLSHEMLAKSRFQELFAFYGKNDSQKYIKNLVPKEILRSHKFQNFLKEHPTWFEVRGHDLFIINWGTLDARGFHDLPIILLESRGPSDSIKMMKNKEAWTDKQTEMDNRIPGTLSEEWVVDEQGTSKFQGFEIPMEGGVSSPAKIELFLKNVLTRLDIFHDDKKAERAAQEAGIGHVHWVTDFTRLPDIGPQMRETLYQSVLGYFGSANDHISVRDNVLPDHVRIDLSLASQMGIKLKLQNEAVGVLTRSDYQFVAASPNGIIVTDPHAKMGQKERNIPLVLRNLKLGLRGIYGQPKFDIGKPIPKIGLESRNELTIFDSLNNLPATKALDSGEIELDQLLTHKSPGPRGLETDQSILKGRATELGIDNRLITILDGILKDQGAWEKKHTDREIEQIRGQAFIPLNDWLNHPRVKFNLERTPPLFRNVQRNKLNKARETYIKRMNHLIAARLDPKATFHPDFEIPLADAKDGINRVYPRATAPKSGEDFIENDKKWFGLEDNTMAVISPNNITLYVIALENSRFIRDSGLAYLLSPH